MNQVRRIVFVVLFSTFSACAPEEEDSREDSEAACEVPCGPCVDAFDSCKTGCVALDQTAIGVDCKAENRAYLRCISEQGVCFDDNAGAENPVCTEENEAKKACIGTH